MDLTEFEKNGEIDDKIKDNGTHDGENTGENGSPAPSSSPPAAATKGRGLRKWRRIRRESGKETNSGFDSNRKRGPIAIPIGGMKQKSEGSSSSTNAVFNRNNGPMLADLGSDFATRAESENSEDRNSRSSTGASVPNRSKNPEPVIGNSKNSVKSSGDNLPGKGRGGLTNKKARGVKIKKENSISSVESDSRSSNFVFNRGTNGGGNFRSGNYDEDYSDDGRNGGDRCVNEEGRNGNDGDFEGISRDDLGAENSWEVKEEKVDKDKSGDRDDFVESVMPLHLAQEALERELEKLRDVGKEDYFSNDTKISELESVLNYENMKFEHEEILKQRIAAEIEFLVILDTIQNLKMGCKDQSDLMLPQKNVSVSEPVPVPEKVEIEDEGESARKLRKRVWRYGFWFVIQLVLFVVVVYLLVLQFSCQNMEVLPT
ncbi:hypothetical protein OSB04_007859 [Centaurea solstitialis]|uniref:Uncharacterized protein n=1 Tax=Centaurea solstitialis TaxID=347529 RepID=A0AA38WST8_9ASTR|nr:hypothetical protein OSB04_007859 [Centaurea solstitialis]